MTVPIEPVRSDRVIHQNFQHLRFAVDQIQDVVVDGRIVLPDTAEPDAPTQGVILWSEGGELKAKVAAGTITVLASP